MLPVLLVLFLLSRAFAGNILMVYDLPSPSHQLWDYTLAEGLMEKGHNVTMLGPFTDKMKSSEKYHPLVVEGVLDAIAQNKDFDVEKSFAKSNIFTYLKLMLDYCLTTCNHSYHTNGFATLLNYPKDFKFDLIIIDVTLSPCFLPLIQRFGYPPTIGVTAFLLPPFVSHDFGNGVQPAYLPVYFSEFSEDMNFFQRVLNYVLIRVEVLMKETVERWKFEKMMKPIFGNDVDPLEKLQRHITILLCNLVPGVAYAQPFTPNVIPVGGLHVKKPKQLPPKLLSVIENAEHGVILFALGTNVRSANLKPEVKKALLEAFGKLKQTVVWKFEDDNLGIPLPKNVVIRKWLPQNDILAHPNTKLFISHGGALSTFEAIYHAVPVIGIPFFIDQKINVNSLVEKKLALKIDVHNFTADELVESVQEMLTNPVYAKNFQHYSRRMRDQPEPPLERAVFWAEYAMRHNGADFLNPKSRDMPLFVSSSMDVILFLTAVGLGFIYIVFQVLKQICLSFRTYSKLKSTKKEKSN